MKMGVFGVVVAMLAIGVIGCSKKESAGTHPTGAPTAARQPAAGAASATDKMAQERDATVGGASTMLDKLQSEIANLQAAAEKKGADVKADYEKNIKPDLDKRVADVKSAIDKAKTATGDAWASAKEDLGKAMAALGDAYQKAREKVTPAQGSTE